MIAQEAQNETRTMYLTVGGELLQGSAASQVEFGDLRVQALFPACSVTWGKSHNLSELHFLHLLGLTKSL